MHPLLFLLVSRSNDIKMQRLKSTLFTLAFLALTCALSAQERIEKTFSNIENIRLTTASGNGTIKKGNGNEVRVLVEYTYDEDDYKPEFEQRGSTLIIEEDFRRSRWTRGYSEWTIEIPNGLDVEFKTGSGNVEVNGLEITLEVGTGSGNIELEDLKGDVRANTGSGNLTFYNLEGPLDANTGSGSIRIDGLKGDADLNTGSGNIKAQDAEGDFGMNTGSGNLVLDRVVIAGNSSFNTGSGNVEVVLGGALDYDLALNTGSGDATLDFDGQKIEGKFIMKANDKDDIRAPFKFDESYGDDDDDDRRGWRGRNRRYTKEATIGNKDIVIRISTGSGRATVKE